MHRGKPLLFKRLSIRETELLLEFRGNSFKFKFENYGILAETTYAQALEDAKLYFLGKAKQAVLWSLLENNMFVRNTTPFFLPLFKAYKRAESAQGALVGLTDGVCELGGFLRLSSQQVAQFMASIFG